MTNTNIVNFRCKHRHSAISHPNCYLKFLRGDKELEKKINLPKILIMDLETALLKAWVYQKSVWKANITDENVISEWFALTWSAKWLFDENIMSSKLTGREAVEEDDSRIVKELWDLFNEADIIIAHNASGFDVPNMNTRFLLNSMPPTKPYQLIDTLQVAKRQFGFTHNSLDALARMFGLDDKIETNFELWKRCTMGDDSALKEMEIYNKHDVELLESVYLRLRPWIRGHPNMALYSMSDSMICPNCGSKNVQLISGSYTYTSVSVFPLYVCECGAYSRGRKSVLTTEKKSSLIVPLQK